MSETKKNRLNEDFNTDLAKLSKGNPSLEKVGKMYADCWADDPSNRDLSSKGDYLNPKDFLYAAKTFIPGGYNQFDSRVAAGVVRMFGMSAKYSLSREGSVAVYVKTPDLKMFKNTEKFREKIAADEFSIEGNEIRIWWD